MSLHVFQATWRAPVAADIPCMGETAKRNLGRSFTCTGVWAINRFVPAKAGFSGPAARLSALELLYASWPFSQPSQDAS